LALYEEGERPQPNGEDRLRRSGGNSPRGIIVQPLRRLSHHTLVGLSIYAAFLIAIVAWFAFFQFPGSAIAPSRGAASDSGGQAARYTGTLVIPRAAGGGCRQMTFNNNSGAIAEVGVVACPGDSDAATSPVDRMGAIRDAFSKK
jgi:hypothetical protein